MAAVERIGKSASLSLLLAIPGGEFLMGDDDGRPDERPAHRVRVRPFLLARFPVTNQEYAHYLAETGGLASRPWRSRPDGPAEWQRLPAAAPEPRFWRDERFSQRLQPVVGVSWPEAEAYCAWLSQITGLRCRLPTEAEREWAAMGGLERSRYPWGDGEPDLVGPWAPGNAGQDRPLPVSDDAPNGFGLCHMGDNVHEWCSDWWDPDYYAESPVDSPRGPATGWRRASRGGAWRHYLKFSRCSARSSLVPRFRYNDYGFRVAGDCD